MTNKDYRKDIQEIKQLMNRSSRFLSLSGLAGVFAGVYAIVGAFIGYYFLLPEEEEYLFVHSYQFRYLLVLMGSVLLLSIVTAIFLTTRRAKKSDEKIWDLTTQRLVVSFLIPFVTGAIYILIKVNTQHYGLTAALMLIFYGLALVNASKYTFGNVKYLGYAEIVLGLICAGFPGYGFWFWVAGFGLCHIIYGTFMHFAQQNK